MKRVIACVLFVVFIIACVNSIAFASPRRYTSSSNSSGNEIFGWFIGILVGLFVLCVIIGIVSLCKADKSDYNDCSHAKITSNTSGTTLYVPIEMIEGKIIDGHGIKTFEDRDRWNVKKGFSKAIYLHLLELESTIENNTTDKAKEAYNDWFIYYKKYRNLCLENGMWNDYIADHVPFAASSQQIAKENQIMEMIKKKYTDAESSREKEKPVYSAIMDYIKTQPGHTVQRSEMIHSLAATTNQSHDRVNSVYRKMVRAGILTEKIVDHHYVVKKTPSKRKPKLKPSVYMPEKYEKVDRFVKYKIEYTVGQPQNVDRITNTCEFVSQSSGERYYTSLEKCTCPANYGSRYACKHMVALAVYLSYFDLEKVK